MTFLTKASEIPEGERKLVRVGGVDVAVFRQGGRFYALNNACPHRQGPLSRGTVETAADASGCFVRCPMHGWRFHLETGDSHGRPANVTVYALDQRGEELYIEI